MARGTLTVCAVVAPLLTALGLFVGSTEREPSDIAVLVAAGVLLPALPWLPRVPVRNRAVAAIFTMLGTALYLTARAGFAAGLNSVIVCSAVLGGVILGRRLGLALIGMSALAQVIVGVELRTAASTSVVAVVLALIIDFVIRHVEASARATTAALAQLRDAHEALRESEERYRSLVDHSLDGVLLTTPSGDVLEANPAACQLLQRTPEEIRALGRGGLVDFQDPRLGALIEECRLTGKLRGELNLIRKDGKPVPIEVGSAAFRDRNGELRSSVSIRDLTDRRRSEKEQRLLAELGAVLSPLRYESSLSDVAPFVARNLADLVVFFVVQPDGELHRVAAAARDPEKAWVADAILTSLDVVVPPDHPAQRAFRERKPVITAFAPGSMEALAQTPEHRRALRALQLRSSMVIPLDIGDVCHGALGLASSSEVFDETDFPLALEIARRCALFIESARLHRSEKAAIQRRDEVLAIVAHDLRNPLATMMYELALLRRPPGQPERRSREPIELLQETIRRMSRILQDLLDVGSFESGRLELVRTRVSPPELIAEISRSQRGQVNEKSLALLTEAAPGLPDVWADRSRILQVFENLIGNAIRFTAAGGIRLGARREGREVLFWVADTGVGIEAKDVPHLFDRFWQARRSRRDGVGLGLSIVREIVQAHGGRVWVDSAPGSGSTFFFTLPAFDAHDA